MSTIINARSPYYIKVEPATGTLSSASMELFIYSGTFTTDKPGTPQYTISKDIIGTNNYVIYEITELIRDYLNTEYASFATDGVWVEADITLTKTSGSETQNLDYLSFDGYGYFEDGVNPRTLIDPVNTLVDSTTTGTTTAYKLIDSTQTFLTSVAIGDTVHNDTDTTQTTIAAIDSDTQLTLKNDIMTTGEDYRIIGTPNYTPQYLQSNTKIYFKQGTDIVFPVFAEAAPLIEFISDGGANVFWEQVEDFWNLYDVSWGNILNDIQVSDSTDSTQKIVYIRVTPTDSLITGDTIIITSSVGTSQVTTLTLEAVCEPKYQELQVIFYNKFGALQVMPFFKKSTTSIATSSSEFQRDIMNYTNDPTYDKSKHVIATLGINGKEKISMNTGYIKESFNEVIRQLLLSEQIWVDNGTDVLPINLNTKSLTFKKSVNDRLINYSLDFNYSFDKINNVR